MSVLSEANRTAELATDGVETEFSFSLLIHAESELQVWFKVTGGDYSKLTLNSDYTVIFGTDGGTITTTGGSSPFANGSILMIRHLPITQQTNWLYNDNHTEQTHQDDFDRAVMRDLQIQEELDRCPKFPTYSPTTDITFPEPEANKYIGWNSAGDDLENKDGDSILDGLDKTDGNFIVGDGTDWVVESGATARASMNVDVAGTATAIMISHLSTYNHDNFNTAYSHSQTTHDYAYISGNDGATNVTAAELEELTDGSESALHSHAGGGGSPGGADTQVQYNNGGAFGGDASMTWDDGVAKALIIAGASVVGLNSAVFQPTADSTTFFQINDKDGNVIGNFDTVNNWFGIGTAAPESMLHLFSSSQTVRAIFECTSGTKNAGFIVKNAANRGGTIQFWNSGVREWRFGANDTTDRFFVSEATGTPQWTDRLVILAGGRVGIGEPDPGTLTEWTSTVPYLTLHNSTHEDSDGGRESRITFKGEQSGGEETSLAQFEISHDGASDDQLGKIVASVNTGAGLVTTMTLDSSLNAFFTKIKLTAIGGYAIKLTNKTGGNTVAGQLVRTSFPLGADTDDAFETAGADSAEVIGITLDAGVSDGSEAWVVVSGIADVLMDGGGSIRGDRIISSGTAGSGDVWNVGGAVATHFQEIGHCIETRVGAGLARCILHFN